MGGGDSLMGKRIKRSPFPKICHSYPTVVKFGKVMHYLKKIQKINKWCDTRLSATDISIFYRKSANFALSENTDVDFQMCIISNSFNFSSVFEDKYSLNKYGYNLMMSVKMATIDLLKIKLFWNKVYDAIVSGYNVNNNVLSSDSNYIIEVIIWPKFGNSSISMREVIITLIF